MSSRIVACMLATFLLVTGCDSFVTDSNNQEKSLLPINEHGISPLPDFQDKPPVPTAFDSLATQQNQTIPQTPAYDMLNNYADAHPANPHVAVIGVWNVENEHYEYRALPLSFPDSIVTDAKGLAYFRYQLDNPKRPIRNLAALIPPGPKARDLMFRWLQVKQSETKSSEVVGQPKKKAASTTSTTVSDVNYYANPFCDEVVLPDGSLYIYNCQDPITITHDETVEFQDMDGQGDDQGWPSGGNSDSCLTNCSDGGTGGNGNPDPCNGPNPPASCQDDESKPCEGNPVKNPEVASSGTSGKNGGRFGPTRVDKFGNPVEHEGLDIASPVGSNLFAMFGGTVSSIRTRFSPNEYEEESFGNYVQVTSQIDGRSIVFKYNHLRNVNVNEGENISQGDIIGTIGRTGNAASGGVNPHVHITTWDISGSGWNLKNPENYISAEYDSNGDLQSNCN